MRLFKRYHPMQVLLHWLIACLILVQYATGGSIQPTHDAVMMGQTPDPTDMLFHQIHNRSGMIILLLMLIRLTLRVFKGVPPISDDDGWRRHAAGALHWAFYGVLIAQAMLGLTASYIYWPVSGLHVFGARLLLAMIALHVLAALWHQIVKRDHTLGRMLGSRAS